MAAKGGGRGLSGVGVASGSGEGRVVERRRARMEPSRIRNKMKRMEVFAKLKAEKARAKSERRRKRRRTAEASDSDGVKPPPAQRPRTIESMREADDTFVDPADEEVARDEAEDEFSAYFSSERAPKVLLTTSKRPSAKLFPFLRELLLLLPAASYYNRHGFSLSQITTFATRRDFTHIVVVGEHRKVPHRLLLIHLPIGPTMLFRLSTPVLGWEIEGHGNPSKHIPELVLNNFATRLGHRVGRFLGSLYPHRPEFRGRRVVTFHNQRDYVFVRHHRYIFRRDRSGKLRANLQELGPRLTLKLLWVLAGTFHPKTGAYEWFPRHKEIHRKHKFQL